MTSHDTTFPSPYPEIYDDIRRGAAALNVTLNDTQLNLLVGYVGLLHKWNKAYNLTAIRDVRQMVARHIIDSLSIVNLVQGDNVLDVGSGPGLPGVILAIMYPEKQLTTLDSNGKKTRFMSQAKMDLKLTNLTVVNERVECYQPERPFDAITSRAFASLTDMVEGTQHLLATSGVYLAMKGLYPEDELNDLLRDHPVTLVECVELHVPGTDGDRHLVILQNRSGNACD